MPKPKPRSAPPERPSLTSWISRSVAGLLGREKPEKPTKPKRAPKGNRPVAPTKAETAQLPRFEGLDMDRIRVPKTKAECEAAAAEILAAGVAGFDTEARPTFTAGEKSTGPHVVQFALTDRAFIFQLRRRECEQVAADLIASDKVLKVGFGLKNDHGQIRDRLGVRLTEVLDLDHVFRQRGYRGQIGVRGAMGAVLKQNFPKSKSTTTSNWAAAELTTRQLCYAANDAFSALKIMEALGLQSSELSQRRSAEKVTGRRRDGRRSKS